MSFLETVVFPDVMEIIPSDDDSSVHLQLHDNTAEDTSADFHIAGEWAFPVDVVAINGFPRGFVSETDALGVTLSGSLLTSNLLFLESTFVLFKKIRMIISAVVFKMSN